MPNHSKMEALRSAVITNITTGYFLFEELSTSDSVIASLILSAILQSSKILLVFQNPNQNCLLVTHPKDNHSQGPVTPGINPLLSQD